MRIFIVLVLLAISVPVLSKAKRMKANLRNANWEMGLMLGTSKYSGDLGTDFPFIKEEYHVSYGIVSKYQFHYKWGLRSSLLFGKFSGNDSYSPKKGHGLRNLNFSSNFTEFQVGIEYFPWSFSPCFRMFRPFIFGSLALFHFNPTAIVGGNVVFLKPLSTEGQGLPVSPNIKYYSLLQPSIPFGIGFKWSLKKRIIIGAEVGLRKTFTDYIDDVSGFYPGDSILIANRGLIAALASKPTTASNRNIWKGRGNPKFNDGYLVAGFTCTYLIRSWCYKIRDSRIFSKKRQCYRF
jgi:hypothetical protein